MKLIDARSAFGEPKELGVEQDRMTQDKADWETECMEAIVQKLKEIAGRRE